MNRKDRGITLVALIVTIIILIILATISIGALFGENGLIKKANDAKTLYEQEAELERLQMIKAVVLADTEAYSGKLNSENYIEELIKQGITDGDHVTEKDGVYTVVTDTGHTVTIYDDPDGNNDVEIEMGEMKDGQVVITAKIKNVTRTSGRNSLQVNVTLSTNNKTGVTYNYYYRVKDEGGNYQEASLNSTDGSYTIEGLKENTNYEIKVELLKNGQVVDTKEGIVGTTKSIPSAQGVVSIPKIDWENGEPKVTVKKTKVTKM